MKKTLIAIILALALVLTFATSVAFAGDEVLALKGAPYVATTDTKLEKTDDVYYTNNSENGFAYVLPTEGAEGYVVTYSTEKEGTYNSYDGSAIKTEGTYYFKESKEGQSSDIVTVVVDYTAPVFTDFETFVATNWANLKLDVKDKFVAPQYTAEEGVTVYVEYAKNGSSIKDGWTEVAQDKEINITLGYYAFRYVLKDKAGNETHSESITVYVTDTLVPTVDASDLANEKVEEGSTYTVQKPDITDHSSYTSYYTVSKDGTVIYNSDSGEIAEGYEAMFATSGAIVTAKGDAGKTLVITYYVTDANGNKAEPVSYNLSITEKEETETQKAVHVWQYIFFGLAIVAFIGIILVIVIKPKQNDAPTGGRVHYAKEPKAEEPQAKEPAQEETPVEEPAEEPAPAEEPTEAPAEEEPQAEEVPAEETPAEEPQAEEPKTEE